MKYDIKEFAGMTNIAIEAELEKDLLYKIGNRVLLGFNTDNDSQAEWMADVGKVEELVSLISKTKNTPLPNSANVKYPIVSKACYEWSARVYPEIIQDSKIAKYRVIGKDPLNEKAKQGANVSEFINYQLLLDPENPEWETQFDRLLFDLGMIGFLCTKEYYDPVCDKVKSIVVPYKDLIINSNEKSLETCRRISHVLHYHLNDLIESMEADVYCKEPIEKLIKEYKDDELDPKIDVVEQHTFYDLDGDGYLEPYIITFVKQSGDILRIAPRFKSENVKKKSDGKIKKIVPNQHFTDFHFLVSPKGKFQSVGFGILMLHPNEMINSVCNQLLDAGQLSNMQGGYMDARLQEIESGNQYFDPGEWKKLKALPGVTIKEGIVPITYKEPSNVLFQLLNLLIMSAKDLSSSSEVMTGGTNADNAKTGAVQALQKEGLKIFNSIYRRLYRSISKQLFNIYKLNAEYLDEKLYYRVLDDDRAVFRKDFDDTQVNIIPVADPNFSSELQKAMKNQSIVAAMSMPGVDPVKCTRRILMNSDIENPEELLMDETAQQKPNPEVIKIQADIEKQAQDITVKHRELDLKEKELKLSVCLGMHQCLKLKADAILAVAKAESEEATRGLNEYMAQVDIISSQMDGMVKAFEFQRDNVIQEKEFNLRQQELDRSKPPMSPEAPIAEAPPEGVI